MIEIIAPQLAAISFNFNNVSALIALAAGILILMRPKLLNYVVAIYLIAIGVMGIIG